MTDTKTKHYLKTIPQYFEDVASGSKTFEFRKNDRDYQVGDILILQEYFPETLMYSGLTVRRQITYILENFNGIEPGYAILGIKEDEDIK
jgi:hypothetical protein